MITLHHLEYSQSFRVLWLLEELGAPYELKLYQRDPKTRLAPADYKALSPLGTAPVITDGQVTLAESTAVMDYILDQHDDGRLRPEKDAPNRVKYLFWYNAANGSMMPMLLMNLIFDMFTTRAPFFARPILKAATGNGKKLLVSPRMTRIIDAAEADLAQSPWFAGDALTAADIVMSYGMESARSRGFIRPEHKHCNAWIERMQAYPSYQAALRKDGKDSAIFTG